MPDAPAQPQSAISTLFGVPQQAQSSPVPPMIPEGTGAPVPQVNSPTPPIESVTPLPNYTVVPTSSSVPHTPSIAQTPQSSDMPSAAVQSPVAPTSHWASALDGAEKVKSETLPVSETAVQESVPAPESTYSYPGKRPEQVDPTQANTIGPPQGNVTSMFAPVSGAVAELPSTSAPSSNAKTAVTLGVLAFMVGILAVVGGYYVLSTSQDGRVSQSNIPAVAVRSDMPTPQVQGNVSEDSLSDLSGNQEQNQSAVLSDSTSSVTPAITKEVLSSDTKPKPQAKKRVPTDPLIFTGVEVLDGMKKYTNTNAEFSFTAPSAWIQCKTKTPLQPELGMGWFDTEGCPLPEETQEPMVLITFHTQSIDTLSEKNLFSLTLEQLKATTNFDLYTTSEKSGSTKYYTYVAPLPTGGFLSVLIPTSVPKETRLSTIESFELPK